MEQRELEKIILAVQEAIQKNVNGKIDNLTKVVTDYIAEDMKWKEEADPYIKLASHISGTWKFLVYVVTGILVFFGLYSIIQK